MARGIRRLVQLILDRDSARKMEQDAQGALKKGTDPKAAKNNLSVVQGGMDRLRKAAIRLGVALGAAFAVRNVTRFGKASVRVAMEASAIWGRLEGQLANVGVRLSEVQGEIDARFRDIQDRTTMGDEDSAAVLTELVGITGDYAKSLEHVELVADVAAAKKLDFRTASMLVGRTLIGETSLLKRYGIVVAEGGDAIQALRDRFGGMAEHEARSLSGMVEQLNNEWGDFQQAVGEAMIEAGGGTSIIETLTAAVKAATGWVNENGSEIGKWGTVTLRTFGVVGQTVGRILALLKNGVELIVDALTAVVAGAAGSISAVVSGVIDSINWVITQANKIPRVNIPLLVNNQDPEGWFRLAGAAVGEFRRNNEEAGEALKGLGRDWLAWGRDVRTAVNAADTAVTQSPALDIDGGGPPEPTVKLANSTGAGALTVDEAPTTGIPPVEADGTFDRLMSAAERAALEVQDSFGAAFSAVREEGGSASDAMAAAFDAVASSGAGAVADLAKKKVAEHVAAAFGAAAYALGFTSHGNFASASAAWGAAGKHTLAASAYGSLAGATGAAAASIGGGGGSSFPSGSRDATGRMMDSVRSETHVHVYVDPLDPQAPQVKSLIYTAWHGGAEEYGKNVTPHYHPTRSWPGSRG